KYKELLCARDVSELTTDLDVDSTAGNWSEDQSFLLQPLLYSQPTFDRLIWKMTCLSTSGD
ncbi:Hypothetical predicted protein, partial [Marmota monax]